MIKLSASSVGTYKKCPKQYHYRYIEKPKVAEQDWSHLELGKCAHRILELFHKDLMETVRDPKEYASLMRVCAKEALKEFKLEVLRPDLPELRTIIQEYLNVILQSRPTKGNCCRIRF